MNLAYTAYDSTGAEVAGTIDAANAVEASESLRGKGLFVTRVEPVAQGHASVSTKKAGRVNGKRLKKLMMFTRQLYVLVSSGTPLVDALSALERQIADTEMSGVIAAVRHEVDSGRPLSAAMADHPRYFDAIYRSLVAAGESSGELPKMLNRLGELTQRRMQVRNSIVGAMVYPILLLTLALGVTGVLMVFVIPRFKILFDTLDVPLPPTTEMLIGLSDNIRAYWWGVLGAVIAGVVLLKVWLGTSSGRRGLDTFKIRMPPFGRITRSFAVARITRMLGLLLESRVPLLEALRLTRDGAGNYHYEELLDRVEHGVTQGEAISDELCRSPLITPSIAEAIRSGEQSGRLGPLLLDVAGFLDEDNETIIRSLTSVIEPIILVFLGLLVGGMAVSLFMPLFDITAMTQGGG